MSIKNIFEFNRLKNVEIKNIKNNKLIDYKIYSATDVPDKEFTGPF